MRAQAGARAARLQKHGIQQGDNVIILHMNSAAFVADLFAVWATGACAACLDPAIGPSEFAWINKELGAECIIVSEKVPDQLAKLVQGLHVMDTQDAYAGRDIVEPQYWMDDNAITLFTSGSTGMPKGVVHTHRSLQSKWQILSNQVPLERCRKTLCFLPTNFGHGLICNLLFPLMNGQDVVLAKKADMGVFSRLGKIIDDHDITFMSSVPSAWRIALRVSPKPENGTLQQIHIGSAPLSASLWREVKGWSGCENVWNVYGITETGSWIAGGFADPSNNLADGLVGPGWGATFAILEDKDGVSGSPVEASPAYCAAGEAGHVWVRTPCLMREYLNRPDETADVVAGTWFKTGDIGKMDASGNLYIVGRERSDINKGGIKVSPTEIEFALENSPAIQEACAFPVPDRLLGENIGVCIVPSSEAGNLSKAELAKWFGTQVSSSKVPIVWYVVDDIPKTSRGKVVRADVAAFCEQLNPL